MRTRIDKLDMKLIHVLAVNSRMNCKELAEKVGISRQSAAKRLKKLKKMNIILRYTIIPDFDKLEYIYASLGITLEPGAPIDRIVQKLKKDRDVKAIERGIGSHNLIVRIAVSKKMEELEKKINVIIEKIGHVQRYDTTIITKIEKFETL